jgi:hypothetical protein
MRLYVARKFTSHYPLSDLFNKRIMRWPHGLVSVSVGHGWNTDADLLRFMSC